MMFMLLFHGDDRKLAEIMARDPEPLMRRHVAFNKMVRARTRLIASHALQPAAATVTVRPDGDERVAEPGPAVDSPVVLNGFYLINCKDLAEAVEIARAYPMPPDLGGYVEVRPTVSQWKTAPIADTGASTEEIWARYTDVASWPEWLDGVAAASLDGPFAADTTGELRLTDGTVRPLRLVTVKEPESFTMETGLGNGIWLWTGHYLTPTPDGTGTRITHEPVVPHHALDVLGLHYTATVNEQAAASVARLAELVAATRR